MNIKASTAPDLLRRFCGSSHLTRRAISNASRREQDGIQGAAEERKRLAGEFISDSETFTHALIETDAVCADFRLAANILKHRIRSFDAPADSWSAKATFLVRARAADAVLDDRQAPVAPPPLTTAPGPQALGRSRVGSSANRIVNEAIGGDGWDALEK